MLKKNISRRGFVIGGIGVATAAVGASCMGLGFLSRAQANEEPGLMSGAAASLCNACPHQCGYIGHTHYGQLTQQIALPAHPAAAGRLCAKGYGYSQIAYSPNRLTDPLKRTANGDFAPISWKQALTEIAERLGEIDPRSLALVHGFAPTGTWYGRRFMEALGCANCYADAASTDLSFASGTRQALGTEQYEADTANAKLTVLIGANPAEDSFPRMLQELLESRQKGGRVVVAGPRCCRSTVLADEWMPLNPGTELAFVLALANVLVTGRHYDAGFIEQWTLGFEDWEQALLPYSPAWAERVCGVSAAAIARLAAELAAAKPAAAVIGGWAKRASHAYANAGETARAICLLNTLLGNWNQKGGLLLFDPLEFNAPEFDALGAAAIPPVPRPSTQRLGDAEYPLAAPTSGSVARMVQAADEGRLAGALFYESDPAASCSNTAFAKAALQKLSLTVVIDVQMTATALLADYVLPETSYLERFEIPQLINGKVPSVAVSTPVIEQQHLGTRTADNIFTELASLCGVGHYFSFSIEELASAQADSLGLSLAALKREGIVYLSTTSFSYGRLPKLQTPSGKIAFTSDACKAAGYGSSPLWVEPEPAPELSADEEQLLLISSEGAASNLRTNDIEDLGEITQHHNLTRAHISSAVAARLGLADGDEIEVAGAGAVGRVRAKVSQAINPAALYLPSGYGCTSPALKVAHGVGLNPLDFVPFRIEPGYGAALTQGVPVTVRKVGA
jgi:thiosulfate reductase/polysulfide reductase chain A